MQNKSYEEVAAEILSTAIATFPNSFKKTDAMNSSEVAAEIAEAYKIIFQAVMSSRRNSN